MRVSKNIRRGSLIDDFNELVQLAEDRCAVVVYMGGSHFVRPAAFMLNWSVAQILRTKIYHALPIKDDTESNK